MHLSQGVKDANTPSVNTHSHTQKNTGCKEESTRVHHTQEERRGGREGQRRVVSTEAIELNKHQLVFDM